MKNCCITIITIFLLSTVVDTTSKKVAILEELNVINKRRLELLKSENQVFKRKLIESREVIRLGNESKRVLIEELESLGTKYSDLESKYHKRTAINRSKTIFAVIGVPLGIATGWGIRDLYLSLRGK